MAATRATLRPEDGAEMLSLAQQMDEATRRKDNAKRDLVRAFLRSPVLLAGGLSSPLALPSTETGVFVAFTDEEAAEAWADERHPAAPPVGWDVVPAAGDERTSRSLWLDRLEAARAAVISVNPSGPMSFLVYHQELTEWKLRLRRAKLEAGDAPWLDLDARAQERARLKGMMQRLSEVVASGQLASMESFSPELSTRNAFGSVRISLDVRWILERWRLHFEQYYSAVYESCWVATTRARTGDPWGAVDSFLETAELIRDLHAKGVKDDEHRGFLQQYWRYIIKTLPVFSSFPYREAERAALGPKIDAPPEVA